MIVGADAVERRRHPAHSRRRSTAATICKRVYYSAFSPIPDASATLPPVKPPLMREHRLYQADWLIASTASRVDEIAQGARDGRHADLEIDPKLAWALVNRALFPVDVNTAEREELLRVPGLGVKSVNGSCACAACSAAARGRRAARAVARKLPALHRRGGLAARRRARQRAACGRGWRPRRRQLSLF